MSDNSFINLLMNLHILAIKVSPDGEFKIAVRKVGFLFWVLITGIPSVLFCYYRIVRIN